MKGDMFPVVVLFFKQGEYMPPSPSGVGSSPSLPSQRVVAESSANLPSGENSLGDGGVSKAALTIWKKLSSELETNSETNWNQALDTADELARSVCGQNLAEDLRADLLGNFKLLEQSMRGLKITPTDDCPDPHTYIKNRLSVLKLNIVTDAEDFRKLQSLRSNSPI